ncbi:MAG: peptidoglycan DD-metalloendopeptidase family protein [Bacteroidales bacterium]|nr:peptidoglycan DD-metalloendopeptidase family protein [Bacteroidales bacterium]
MKIFHFYLILIFVLSSFDMTAQSRQGLEDKRKKTLQEIAETNRFLKETQQSQKESLEKLDILIVQEKQYNQLISDINAEIKYTDRQINESTLQIKKMGNEVEKLKSDYAEMIRQAYKNRGKYNKLVFVLSSKDFNEAYRRMKYFQQYSEFQKKQVEEINESQKQLNESVEELAAQKKEKEKLLAEQRKESKQLELIKNEQNKSIAGLKSKEKQLRKKVADKQKEAQKLQQEINRLVTAEIKKSKGNSKTLYDKLTPEERLVSNNFKDNKGRLPWPTERGFITKFFGVNQNPIYKELKISSEGIDITTVANADVRAIFDGEVTRVWRIKGENITILLQHGNYRTVYMNVVDVTVKQGDKVKSKETIGKIYTEKGAKTAVLHFEIWEELKKVNPEQWIIKK